MWANSLGYDGRQGACTEYALVPVDRLYRLPGHADPVVTVAPLHPAATAFIGLHHRARLRAGDTVLVGGGAGSIGACVIQLAAGPAVTATRSTITQIYEGTNQIQRMVIARQLLK